MAASSFNSVASCAHSQRPKEEGDVSSVITTAEELKPSKIGPFEDMGFRDMDSKEEIEKFKKYEADYANYLMAKYFSNKNIFGGNIFDVKVTKDGKTIKASRLPPYASYADPVNFLEQIRSESHSAAETSTNTKNQSNSTKKST